MESLRQTGSSVREKNVDLVTIVHFDIGHFSSVSWSISMFEGSFETWARGVADGKTSMKVGSDERGRGAKKARGLNNA